MSGIPRSVRGVAIGYGLLVAVLLPASVFWRSGGAICWLVLATVSVLVIGLGSRLRGSPYPRLWRRAAQLGGIGVVAVALYRMLDSDVHPPYPIGIALLDAVSYLCAVAIALMLLPGRAGRGTWFGGLDPLVLFLTLFVVVATLVALLLSTPRPRSVAETAVLVTYVVFETLIVVILGAHLRREHGGLGAQGRLVLSGVVLLTCAAVGIGASDVRGYHIPLHPLHAAWLAGLILIAVAALVPGPVVPAADLVSRRIRLPTGTVIVILLVGPPLELVDPGFTNVVTLLLVVVVGLLLSEARQRIGNERTIRNAAAALAAATGVPEILSVTLAAAVRFGDRLDRIVLCADGPGGPRMACSDPGDERAADRLAGLRPAAAIDLVFGETGHSLVQAPVAPGDVPPVALGVAGADSGSGTLRSRGMLELLVAQAGQAVQRVAVTDALTRQAGEEYFRTLIANASDMILTIDPDGRIGYASPSAHALTAGSDPGSVDLTRALGPDNARDIRKLLRTKDGRGGTGAPLHWRLTVGQATLEADVRIADLRADPRVGALVVTMRDVTSQTRLYRELHRLAFYDDLTGLGTRAGFAQRYADAATGPDAAPLVLAVDIDGFTELNQLHGRAAGDLVLVAVAARLARVRGYAARLSGGRFVLLVDWRAPEDDVPGVPDRDAAAEARLLHETLSGPVDLDSTRISVAVNVGAADTAGVLDADEALEHAGLAEAEARRDRHIRWRAYDPAMLAAVRERDVLRRDLAAAIAEDWLSVHYQPFVDLRTGRVVGFEALARWDHPERGPLAPGDFIPLAEDTGLIGPLGNWILRRAVRDAAGLRSRPGGDRIHMSVNISAQQLADPRFVEEVSAALGIAGLPPDALSLEVVESSVLDRAGDVAVLRALRATGLMLAIDDFGTGHSALSYLVDLPFQALKIDRSFVTEIAGDPRRVGLVRAIVAIAESLGLTVVAEGIETEADRAVLAAAGCRYGQGYLFSRPVPLAEAEALMGRTWPSEC